MLVVDPATQRSLVVRQSDEREALRRSHQMSAPIRKPHRVFKSRAINRAEIFSTAPGESTFRGFDRQSPARKALGRRKCGLALGPLGESSLFAFVLRDSRGKEGNLEVRRSSGPLQPSWMAVQPPVVPSSTPSVSPPLHVPPTSPFNSTFHFPRTWVNRHAAHAAPPS